MNDEIMVLENIAKRASGIFLFTRQFVVGVGNL
jgi:hypothetical protein